VSLLAYKSLINLCVDICRRNGIKKLIYTGDAKGNLTEHRYFSATLCPGPYLHDRMGAIANAVNAILLGRAYPGVYPKPTVSAKLGTSSQVKLWQKYLCWYGADVKVDGQFGPDTEEKTKTFQRQNRLLADGSVGPATISKAKTIRR